MSDLWSFLSGVRIAAGSSTRFQRDRAAVGTWYPDMLTYRKNMFTYSRTSVRLDLIPVFILLQKYFYVRPHFQSGPQGEAFTKIPSLSKRD